MSMKRLLFGVAMLGVFALMASTAMAKNSPGGSAASVYNAIPGKLPGSVPSEPFEANSDTSFGDEVLLGGPNRNLKSGTVTLVSWGCQRGHWYNGDCSTDPGATFPVPLTFTVYDDNDGTAGSVLATTTQTVNVPYRPTADYSKCTGGRWYSTKDQACYNGYAKNFTLSFPAGTLLPDDVIWAVSYNTTTAGPNPIGPAQCNSDSGGCGYDSLNVGAFSFPNAPYQGTDVNEDEAFRNGHMEGGWTGNRPLGAIQATG
jgi:hypothetical protein